MIDDSIMAFHPIEYIDEELKARGWTRAMLAFAMDPNNTEVWLCALELYSTQTPGLLLGEEGAQRLGTAFGTGCEIWANLDQMWQATEIR